METLYRKVAVEERLPKEEGDYFTNFGMYQYFYDTPQDQAWWDNHVSFFFEPVEIPDPTTQLQADKAELLEALEYANRMLKNSKDAMYDENYIEPLIQKHKI